MTGFKLTFIVAIVALALGIAYAFTYGVIYLLHIAFHFAMLTPLQVAAVYVALCFIGGFFRQTGKSE